MGFNTELHSSCLRCVGSLPALRAPMVKEPGHSRQPRRGICQGIYAIAWLQLAGLPENTSHAEIICVPCLAQGPCQISWPSWTRGRRQQTVKGSKGIPLYASAWQPPWQGSFWMRRLWRRWCSARRLPPSSKTAYPCWPVPWTPLTPKHRCVPHAWLLCFAIGHARSA